VELGNLNNRLARIDLLRVDREIVAEGEQSIGRDVDRA
jgi:hypothetical protein